MYALHKNILAYQITENNIESYKNYCVTVI